MFQGKVEVGDPCFASEECAGDAVCDRWLCSPQQPCCRGRCVAFEHLSVGSVCPLADAPELYYSACEPGSFCRPPDDDGSGEPPVSGICSPRVDIGVSCVSDEECIDGHRCDRWGSGICYRLQVSGEMCGAGLSGNSCLQINEGCAPSTSTCERLPGPGEPCVSDQCIGYASCLDGTCVARPGLGEICDGSLPCLGDLFCRDGLCEALTVVFACFEGEDPPPADGSM